MMDLFHSNTNKEETRSLQHQCIQISLRNDSKLAEVLHFDMQFFMSSFPTRFLRTHLRSPRKMEQLRS